MFPAVVLCEQSKAMRNKKNAQSKKDCAFVDATLLCFVLTRQEGRFIAQEVG